MERTVKTRKQLQLNHANINKSDSDLLVNLYGYEYIKFTAIVTK